MQCGVVRGRFANLFSRSRCFCVQCCGISLVNVCVCSCFPEVYRTAVALPHETCSSWKNTEHGETQGGTAAFRDAEVFHLPADTSGVPVPCAAS